MAILTTTPSMEHTYLAYLDKAIRDIERRKALFKQVDNGCSHEFIPEKEHTDTKHYHRQLDRSTSASRGLFSASYSSTPIYGLSSSSSDKSIKRVLCNKCLLGLSEDDWMQISGVTNFKGETRKLNARKKELESLIPLIRYPRFIEYVKERNVVEIQPDYSIGAMLAHAKKFRATVFETI